MEDRIGLVLKGTTVSLEGQLQLGTKQSPTMAAAQSRQVTPQARIVEQQKGFANIEIVCACGAKMYLRCEYSEDQVTEQKVQSQS